MARWTAPGDVIIGQLIKYGNFLTNSQIVGTTAGKMRRLVLTKPVRSKKPGALLEVTRSKVWPCKTNDCPLEMSDNCRHNCDIEYFLRDLIKDH